jgi:hypothetical protein
MGYQTMDKAQKHDKPKQIFISNKLLLTLLRYLCLKPLEHTYDHLCFKLKGGLNLLRVS